MWKLAKRGIKSASRSWSKMRNGFKISEQVLMFSAQLTHRAIVIEHVFRPGLQHSYTCHKYLNHPSIYRTRPSSSGQEA
eukprot:1143356-Pelagomonas_calceolata.AAC.5